jgi:crossover junction endodeoxyribonuclease RusA
MMHADAVSLTLPWPPSTNAYWRHVGNRTLLSKAGRAYKVAVRAAVLEQIGATQPMAGPLALQAELYPPDRRRRDIDNHAGKGLLDALTDAGVWGDDSQIVELHALMQGPSKPGHVQVFIQCRGEI